MNNDHQLRRQKKARGFSSGRRAAREIFLLCATADMSPARVSLASHILSSTLDWDYLHELSEFHNVSQLIANNLINSELSGLVPASYLERLVRVYKNSLYRNIVLASEQEKILSEFDRHGINTILLKGTALSEQLYGDPGMRTVGDIDILVEPHKLAAAGSLLLEMGYQQSESKQTWDHPFHDIPYYKQLQFPSIIELHWNLQDPRLVSVPLEQIWRRAYSIPVKNGKTSVLSPEDTLLLLASNLPKISGHRLRALCDIFELLKKYRDVLDWEYVIESSHSWGVEIALYYTLKRIKEILAAPISDAIIKRVKPGFWRCRLLDFFCSKEYFISSIYSDRLRTESSIIFRSLTMKSVSRMLQVLYAYNSGSKRTTWLRTGLWVILVFGIALWRNISLATFRRNYRLVSISD
jgi:hypothetical protein